MMSVRVSGGASRRLRWGALGLAGIATILAIATNPADARARRHHHHSEYSPPYASIVVDANTGTTLQATNADSPRHPASLTKVMTLFLLFEQIEAGHLQLDSRLTVSAHAAAQPPTKLGLKPGESISVENAIKAVVTRSANDIAVVIAEAIGGSESSFARMMTRKAHALGMRRTTYVNASGLPDDEQLTTARDQATLGRAIQEQFPRYYRYFATESFEFHGRSIANHNHLLGHVEGVDGIKTGYTRDSGFNLLTSMWQGKRHVVAVVMGGTSAARRDAKMRDLLHDNIREASVRHSAERLAAADDSIPLPSRKPLALYKFTAVASAEAATAREATAAIPRPQRPVPGSTDPIKPLLVKTVAVKPSADINAPERSLHRARVLESRPAAASPPLPPSPPSRTVAAAQEDGPPAVAMLAKTSLAKTSLAKTSLAKTSLAKTSLAKAALAKTSLAKTRPPAPAAEHSGWMIQVGAFDGEQEAKERLSAAQRRAEAVLGDADAFTETVEKGDKKLYRARFAGLDEHKAKAACRALKRKDIACMILKN